MTRTRFLAASALAIASATMAHAEATVAFLMPDQASTRYEQHDYPGFKAAMDKLCPDCTFRSPTHHLVPRIDVL